jgi:hypothetical protein
MTANKQGIREVAEFGKLLLQFPTAMDHYFMV